ncbi:MAG: B12-binding domain-containing radical SAM protein, partial [Deltaproteobacteria bacterium]|nr:B12-binding domain-containing radical SAM protein [Deltaproteobacteria bacterium]
LFVWPNKDSFGYKPISISLLSGIARQRGWETALFDTTGFDLGYADNVESGESASLFKPVDLSVFGIGKVKTDLGAEFRKALEESSPDLLAFSVLSDEYQIAASLSATAKKWQADLPIIWGNKYPTLNPGPTLLEHQADYACLAEGLDVFGDFLEAMESGRDLKTIPNIWAKSKRGEIIENPIRPLRKELDDLPYVDWTIFDRRQFIKPFDGQAYVSGDHMLNWGCPYSCTYCINAFTQKIYEGKYFMRRYGVPRIIAELKHLKKTYDLAFFKFHDEDFLMRPVENFRQLSAAYREAVNLPFTIETNPKSVTEEKARLLKEMNCASVTLAIETGDQKMRRQLLKRVDTKEDIIRAFGLLKELGIRTSSFNMLAIPFESRQTFQATIQVNRKAQVQYPNAGFFYPFEGTRLREIAIEEGFFDPNRAETAVYRRDVPALRFKDVSQDDLIAWRNVFVLYVKLPEVFAPFIRRSEALDELGRRLRSKLLEIFHRTVWKNDGWYVDDGRQEEYMRELRAIAGDDPLVAREESAETRPDQGGQHARI